MKRMFMAAAATAAVAAGALAPGAAAATQVIREADVKRQLHNTTPTGPWVLYNRGLGNGTFVNGPATPPLGTGSLELNTPLTVDPTQSSKAYLFNYQQIGTRLVDITAIRYKTNRTSSNPASPLFQTAALNIQVDFNGSDAGGLGTLVYEPLYSNGNADQILNTWTSHDAIAGGQAKWWAPGAGIPGATAFTLGWSDILALNPNAEVVGGFGVNQGGGNDTLVSAVDELTFDTTAKSTTFDFEPAPSYTLGSFSSPVDMDVVNSAKAGQNIPVKLRVTDAAGQPVTTDPGLTLTSTQGGSECGVIGVTDAIETYAPSAAGWTHQGDGVWQYNWKTDKTWAGKCRTMTVDVANSQTAEQTAGFLFK